MGTKSATSDALYVTQGIKKFNANNNEFDISELNKRQIARHPGPRIKVQSPTETETRATHTL